MSIAKFHGMKISHAWLIGADFVTILLSFSLATFVIQYLEPLQQPIDIYFFCAAYVLTVHVAFLGVGLYNLKLRESFKGIVLRIFVAVFLAFLVNKVTFDLAGPSVRPDGYIELISLLSLVLLISNRLICRRLELTHRIKKRILVLGTGQRASIISTSMRRKSDRHGLEIIGFIPWEDPHCKLVTDETIIERPTDLADFISRMKVDELVIAIDERRKSLSFEDLLRLKREGLKITDIIDFVERETGQVAVDHLNPSWLLFHNYKPDNVARSFLYWLFNCVIALIILVVTAPIMLITAIAIKLESGISAPILYFQERVGLNGKHFNIYKFTSMRADAEKDGIKWAEKNDPRITRVGSFIRKVRIDELPQLYNVIIGDMYFVGPRPERPQFTEGLKVSIPYYDQRHNVKPGLTGWAQLQYPYGSSEKDALEKLKFDLYYIQNRNFIFDLLILLKTSEIILLGKGR